jgi:hypothetical protein
LAHRVADFGAVAFDRFVKATQSFEGHFERTVGSFRPGDELSDEWRDVGWHRAFHERLQELLPFFARQRQDVTYVDSHELNLLAAPTLNKNEFKLVRLE